MDKPNVVLFSSPNLLAVYLTDFLIRKNCVINIASDNKHSWVSSSSAAVHLSENPNLFFVPLKGASSIQTQYSILLGNLPLVLGGKKSAKQNFDNKLFEKELDAGVELVKKQNSKLLIVLPLLTVGSSKERALVEKKTVGLGNTKIVYVGDLYGVGMDFGDGRLVSEILKNIAFQETLEVGTQLEEVYPISVEVAAKEILRSLFSYWYVSDTQAIARQTTVSGFLNEVRTNGFEVSFKTGKGLKDARTLNTSSFITLREEESETLEKTLQWIIKYKITKPQPVQIQKKNYTVPKVAFKVKRPKKVGIIIALILVLVASPFISLLIAGAGMGYAYKSALSGNLARAKTVLELSSPFAKYGAAFLSFGKTLNKSVELGKRGVSVASLSLELMDGVLARDNNSFDVNSLSNKLSLELDALYKETSFFESEIGESKLVREVRQNTYMFKQLVDRLPALISGDGAKTYLVLFQNNMELRPTGGFIGSFALVTFERGRLIDTSVYDVYSSDGQLKGYVAPPKAIKDYLGEANWYLRDSNWDPDFPTSARRAEWFLDKEIDRTVDGVVALDLEVAKRLVGEFGTITLADYGVDIDEKNLYEKVQHSVEAEFFPGSQKKASFLTALTRELIQKIINEKGSRYASFAQIILESLKERHLQVYLHDSEAQRAVGEWSGEVNTPLCPPREANCASLWFGQVEANVGVNKANYYINRSFLLNVELSPGLITYSLETTLKNASESALNLKNNYKAYMRIFAKKGSSFNDVVVKSQDDTVTSEPEVEELENRLEAGALVEVPAGESKTVIFSWTEVSSLNLGEAGRVLFNWRKQAGTGNDPITVNFMGAEGLQLFGNPAFDLTEGGQFSYNSHLLEDFSAQINW